MRGHFFAWCCGAAIASPLHAQQCTPYWAHMKLPGEGGPYSILTLDDGSGPKLFSILVRFTPQGSLPTMYAREHGRWAPYHDSFFSRRVTRLESYDDGHGARIYGVYELDGSNAHAIARWSGREWIDLGQTPANASIEDLIVHDDGSGPALYVCGDFQAIGGIPAHYSASGWSRVGPPLDVYPRAIQVFDDGRGSALYTIGGLSAPPGQGAICKWDGAAWSAIGHTHAGPFTPYSVFDLGVFDDGRGEALYVGGTMPFVNGVEVRGLARWDGKAWSAPCSRISGITRLASGPDARGRSLLAAGYFTTFAGGTVGQIAQLVGCPNCYADADADGRLTVVDVVVFPSTHARGCTLFNHSKDADVVIPHRLTQSWSKATRILTRHLQQNETCRDSVASTTCRVARSRDAQSWAMTSNGRSRLEIDWHRSVLRRRSSAFDNANLHIRAQYMGKAFTISLTFDVAQGAFLIVGCIETKRYGVQVTVRLGRFDGSTNRLDYPRPQSPECLCRCLEARPSMRTGASINSSAGSFGLVKRFVRRPASSFTSSRNLPSSSSAERTSDTRIAGRPRSSRMHRPSSFRDSFASAHRARFSWMLDCGLSCSIAFSIGPNAAPSSSWKALRTLRSPLIFSG